MSCLHTCRLPFRALLAIAESILDLEQRVVWQISDPDMQRVLQAYPPLKHAAHHIFHAPRIPLQDLLGHPQVVSFVADGSMEAVYSGIYHAKPLIAVALDTEQRDVVARVAALGIGQRLGREDLEGGAVPYRLSVAIERMSNVYAYTAAMQRLSQQLHTGLRAASPGGGRALPSPADGSSGGDSRRERPGARRSVGGVRAGCGPGRLTWFAVSRNLYELGAGQQHGGPRHAVGRGRCGMRPLGPGVSCLHARTAGAKRLPARGETEGHQSGMSHCAVVCALRLCHDVAAGMLGQPKMPCTPLRISHAKQP